MKRVFLVVLVLVLCLSTLVACSKPFDINEYKKNIESSTEYAFAVMTRMAIIADHEINAMTVLGLSGLFQDVPDLDYKPSVEEILNATKEQLLASEDFTFEDVEKEYNKAINEYNNIAGIKTDDLNAKYIFDKYDEIFKIFIEFHSSINKPEGSPKDFKEKIGGYVDSLTKSGHELADYLEY